MRDESLVWSLGGALALLLTVLFSVEGLLSLCLSLGPLLRDNCIFWSLPQLLRYFWPSFVWRTSIKITFTCRLKQQKINLYIQMMTWRTGAQNSTWTAHSLFNIQRNIKVSMVQNVGNIKSSLGAQMNECKIQYDK